MPKSCYLVKAPQRLRVVPGDHLPARRTRPAVPGPVKLHMDAVTIHGRRVAYRTGGWGPLLVLLHGITSTSATWDRVLPALARRYTVLAPDLPGHGRSDKAGGDYSIGAHANTVRDLLDALGYRRATVIGHSLGGGVAMQVAYQYPERVERLVLVAPGGFGREVSIVLRAAAVPGSDRMLGLAAWRPVVEAGTLLAQLLGRLGVRGSTDLEEIGRAYASLSERDARAAFVETLRGVVDYQGQRVTALDRTDLATRFPSLIVWGEQDRVVPVRHGREFHQIVPHTYLAVFERAGHFPHRDEADRFVDVVDEFLAREWGLRRRGVALSA
jgi:pimeloyl-ACP methyl ester carboxylesterase